MIALNTNVLIRVLVDDPGQAGQIKVAREQVRRAKQVFVSQIVQAETVWVLESAYDLDRPTITAVFEQLLHNEAFALQHEGVFQKALADYREHSADFADYLILHESAAAAGDCTLLTFDKRLGKTAGVNLLPS